MGNNRQKEEMREMMKRHQEAVKKQDAVYQKNLSDKLRNVGAGLDEDDLSKVSNTDIIGKGEDSDLRK